MNEDDFCQPVCVLIVLQTERHGLIVLQTKAWVKIYRVPGQGRRLFREKGGKN